MERLVSGAVDAHSCRDAQLAITNKDIGHLVGIAGNQVRGIRLEGNVASVSTDTRIGTRPVNLCPRAVDTNSHRNPADSVSDKDISHAICVVVDKVGSLGSEGYESSISASGRK